MRMSLFERMEKECAQVQAAIVMQQMFRAVYYMHTNNLCHRDLKPENFLFATKEKIEKLLRASDSFTQLNEDLPEDHRLWFGLRVQAEPAHDDQSGHALLRSAAGHESSFNLI